MANAKPTITVETAVDQATSEAFYALYQTAFDPLREQAVARQVLYRDEFMAEMVDPKVWKYVAWEGDEPIGLTTLTRHLETVPWISPEYFTSRFPDHAERLAIYYLGFTLAHPGRRQLRLFHTMLAAVVERLVEDSAVCAYDVCRFNDESMSFGRNIESALHRMAAVTVSEVDAQTYYQAFFHPPASAGASLDVQ